MAMEQPKKPQTAYWLWLGDNRAKIMKELNTTKIPEVGKAAGERWKKLSASEKAPYEKKAVEAKEAYDKAMEEFKNQGGVPAKRARKSDKPEKKERDPNAPKRPVGGAYGCFLAEKREGVKKSLPADHKITDVTKAVGALWAKLSEKEKKPYQDLFQKAAAEYKTAMEEYKKTHGNVEEEDGEEEQEGKEEKEVAAPAAKRGRKAKEEEQEVAAPKAKRGRKAKEEEPAIAAALLKEASSLGFEDALKNLAARADVSKSGKSAKDMLEALKRSKGLVNPAKRALLGA